MHAPQPTPASPSQRHCCKGTPHILDWKKTNTDSEVIYVFSKCSTRWTYLLGQFPLNAWADWDSCSSNLWSITSSYLNKIWTLTGLMLNENKKMWNMFTLFKVRYWKENIFSIVQVPKHRYSIINKLIMLESHVGEYRQVKRGSFLTFEILVWQRKDLTQCVFTSFDSEGLLFSWLCDAVKSSVKR